MLRIIAFIIIFSIIGILRVYPTIHYKVSGVWKGVSEIHYKVSGNWKAITEGYYRVGGVWKQFLSAAANLPVNFYGYFAADPGTDWNYQDGSGTEYNMNGVYIRCSTVTSNGGANTHSHTISLTTGTGDERCPEASQAAQNVTTYLHTHNASHTHGATGHEYLNCRLRVYRVNTETEVPTGLILWYDTASNPAGWVNYAALNTRLARGIVGAAGGVAGASSHSHSLTANVAPDVGLNSVKSFGAGYKSFRTSHYHEMNHVHSGGTNIPLYMNLRPVQAQAGAKLVVGLIGFMKTGESVPSGWTLCNGTGGTPNLIGRFVRGVSGAVKGTGGANTHTHAITDTTGDGIGGTQSSYRYSGGSGAYKTQQYRHCHVYNHTHGATSNLPAWRYFQPIMYTG